MPLILHANTEAQLAAASQHPPHALLITGPIGSGKRAVAVQLAAALLGRKQDSLGLDANWLLVTPPADEPFGIDSVRAAVHFMTLKTAPGKGRVNRIAFLPEAHTMTREAQNALLKLLEEPPAGSMLLLTAVSEQSLLPTIVSRCQVLNLQKPSNRALVEAFVALGHDSAAVNLALGISDGLPGLASTLLDDSQDHPLAAAAAVARTLLAESAFERLAQVDKLYKQREQCLDICYILQQMAHLALQSSHGTAIDRWQRVLRASYDCQQALQARVNAKLAMTGLMLAV